jgi:predicted dehydrogenase
MKQNKSLPSAASTVTRREFMKKASAVAAVAATGSLFKTPIYGQSQAPAPGRVIGANDRITMGIIGVGFGIGQNHLKAIHANAKDNNTTVAAACEIFNKRLAWAKETAGLNDADLFTDYRKLLERKDIDAVLIATHEPWHAKMSIDAMEAGKHVFCEKPLARYLDEAYRVADAVKRTGRTFQLGSQGCSAGGWHKCAEMAKSGKIGTLIWAQGYYCRNSIAGEWNYPIEPESTAANIDWETWLGPVKKRVPFSAEHYHRWRKYYPYSSGLLSDLAPHRLHPLMIASGNPEFPKRVTCVGTRNVHADLSTAGTPEREVPEQIQFLAEFPSGYMITLTCSTVNAKSPGFVIYGHKATLSIGSSGERIELVPEREWSEEIDPETIGGLQAEDLRVHEKNWFDCIRSGKTPNANIDLAARVQTVISLAEMSERLNITCLFDEKTRKITDGGGREIQPITYGTLPLS